MISYKSFEANPDLTLYQYKDFYYNRFQRILLWYYPSYNGNMILFAERSKNDFRLLRSSLNNQNDCEIRSAEEEYFFSVCVFFTSLVPSVFEKLACKEARSLFYQAFSWIPMSAGLGGFVGPEQWLKESSLAPETGTESSYYNTLLDIVLPFHCNEIISFFNNLDHVTDQIAFENLKGLVGDRVKDITEEIELATQRAKEHFFKGVYTINYQ